MRKLIKRLLRKRKRPLETKERAGLKYLFSEAGHDFYTFEKIEVAAARRYLAYIRLVREHELGVSSGDLEVFCEEIITANNQGDTSKVGHLTHTLKAFTELYTDNRRVFELANCFVLVDDEPLDKFVDSYSVTKKALFEASDSVRFFFIKTTLSYLKNILDLPDGLELEDYLKSREVELIESTFLRSTSSNLSGT